MVCLPLANQLGRSTLSLKLSAWWEWIALTESAVCFWLLFQLKQRLAKGFWWIRRASSHDVPLWQFGAFDKILTAEGETKKLPQEEFRLQILVNQFFLLPQKPTENCKCKFNQQCNKTCYKSFQMHVVGGLWKQSLHCQTKIQRTLSKKTPSLLKQIQSKA